MIENILFYFFSHLFCELDGGVSGPGDKNFCLIVTM